MSKAMPSAPVRIIAFRSDKEFEPYRFNAASSAFYLEGYDRDYIVMRSISPEYYPVAVHEFTHLLVKHTGADLPIWFNEGLAELYSTLKPAGKKVLVGEVIPGRFYYLQQHKWLSLEALTSADHNSPYYNERDRAGIFYSESWALMHMLNLSSEYRPPIQQVPQPGRIGSDCDLGILAGLCENHHPGAEGPGGISARHTFQRRRVRREVGEVR